MPAHLYDIGSVVTLSAVGPTAKAASYIVEAQMPPLGTSLQYRIKSEAEGFRRVVVEHELRSIDSSVASVTKETVLAHPGEAN